MEEYDQFEGYDTETLKLAQEELRRTFDQKLNTFRELSNKSERLVYANVTILAIIIGLADGIIGAGFQNASYQLNHISFLSGIVFLFGSLLAGLRSYYVFEITHGVSPDMVEWLVAERPSENTWLMRILSNGYHDWIDDLDDTNQRKARFLKAAYALLFLAAIALVVTMVSSYVISTGGG